MEKELKSIIGLIMIKIEKNNKDTREMSFWM